MPEDARAKLDIEVVRGELLPGHLRESIISLCTRAFEENMRPFFDQFADPTHVTGYYNGRLVCHALWITRYLQVGTRPLLRTAYIEAVATEKAYRNRGFASAILKRVANEVRDFDLAALSPSSAVFYERLGWELWRGPRFIRTEAGLVPSPEDEEVMILRLPRTPDLDVSQPVSAEWREGELW